MTQDTLFLIIASTVGAVITGFSFKYGEDLYKEYQPHRKKHISRAKKFLSLVLRYAVPAALIIRLMLVSDFDKGFVFGIAFNLGVILINISYEIFSWTLRTQMELLNIHDKALTAQTELANTVKGLISISIEHTGIIKSIVNDKSEPK